MGGSNLVGGDGGFLRNRAASAFLHAGVLHRGRDDVVALEPRGGRRGLGRDVGGGVGEGGTTWVCLDLMA